MKKKNLKISELKEFAVKDQEAQQIKGGICATLRWENFFDGSLFNNPGNRINEFDKCPQRQ